MPATLTDVYGYRTASGTLVGIAAETILAVPSTPLLSIDYAGDWHPLNGINPLVGGGPPERYGVTTQTNGTGDWTLVLPCASETEPTSPAARWTLLFPDGNGLSGVVPNDPGPFGLRDLIKDHGWVWTANVYVAPVTAGTFAKGTAVFSGGSATATILFVGGAFAANTYTLTFGPSVDTNDGSIPRTGWSSKTTTGFQLACDTADFVGSVDWEAKL